MVVKMILTKSNEDTMIATGVEKETEQNNCENQGDDSKHQALCDVIRFG